jgi:hypothetical protein
VESSNRGLSVEGGVGMAIALLSPLIPPGSQRWRITILIVGGALIVDVIRKTDWVKETNPVLSLIDGYIPNESDSLWRKLLAFVLVAAMIAVYGTLTWPTKTTSTTVVQVAYVPPSPNSSNNRPSTLNGIFPPPTATPVLIPKPLASLPPTQSKTKPIPKPPQVAPIIQAQAPYGNLAARCDNLGKSITLFTEQRIKERTDPITSKIDYKMWYRENDGEFRFYFYMYVTSIQKEMSGLHIDDPRLDELMQKYEQGYADRQNNIKSAIEFPSSYYLSINEIREIGERFRFLATQVPR